MFLPLFLTLALASSPELLTGISEPVTAAAPEDPVVAQALAPSADLIHKEFDQILAQAPEGIPRGRPGEESLLGYWVADQMRLRASLEIGKPVAFAFTNPGGLRASLPKGPVRVRDIFEAMPFDNTLLVLECSGLEVQRMVREGLKRKGTVPCSGVHFHLGGQPAQPILSITWEDGRPVLPTDKVLVATTDFILSGGDGLLAAHRGKPLLTGIEIRQVLRDACVALGRAGSPLLCPSPGRCTFGPGMREALMDRRITW